MLVETAHVDPSKVGITILEYIIIIGATYV